MATPAAVLSIIVEAQTSKATAALKKFERDLSKADRERAEATLAAEVDKGGFDVFSAMMKKAGAQRADAKLGVDLDAASFAKAHAAVSALDAHDVDIDVDVDRGVLSRIKSVSTALTGLGGAAGGAGGDVGGLGLKLGGLGGSLGAMGPIALAAAAAIGAITVAVAALTASLGAAIVGLGALATGAMGAMTVGFGGVAAIAAPAISSLTDLMSAQEAANKAQSTGAAGAAQQAAASAQAVTAAHQQVADAARGVTDAERQLAMAQRGVEIAQESLTAARKEATRQLQDMRRAALEGETSEKRARLSVAQAEQNLRRVMADSAAGRLDIRDAELSVTEARQNLRDVTIAGNRAQTDWNRAQKGGVDQMPGVVSAQESLDSAIRGVRDAQRGVADAHRGVARALQNLAQQQRQANKAAGAGATQMAALALAAKKAGPAAVAFSHHLKAMGRQWRGLTKEGQGEFFGMLEDGIARVRDKMPLLAKSANRSMHAMRKAFGGFLKIVTGGEFTKFVKVMTRTFGKSIGPFSRAFGNIGKILQRIAIAAAPFVIKMAKAFERITKGWLAGTKDGKKLRETIGGLLEHLGSWLKLGAEIGKVFLNLFKALAGDGKGLVEWMTKGAEALNKWLTSKEGREEIKQFMDDVIPLAKQMLILFFQLSKVALLMFRAIAIILTPALKVVNWVLDKVLSQDGSGLEKLGGVFKWIGNAARNTFEWIKGAWGNLGHILGAPFRFFADKAKDAFGWVKDKAEDWWRGIKAIFNRLKDVLSEPFQDWWRGVKRIFGFFTDKVAGAIQFVKDKWPWIEHALTRPFRGVKRVAEGIFDWFKTKIEWLIGKVKWLLDKIPSLPFQGSAEGEQSQPGRFRTGPGGLPGRLPGQHGGFVTERGISWSGFQHGGVVGRKGLKPGARDTIPALLEVGELVIPKAMVDKTRKNAKLTAAAMTGELGKGHKEASKDTDKFVKNHGKAWDKLKAMTAKTTERFRKTTVEDFQKTSKQSDEATSKMRERVTEGFGRMRGNAVEQAGKMKSGVSGDFRQLTGAVGDGLRKIGKMTNNALKAFGVKKVDFHIGAQGKQRGGLIGGVGDGDKVPVMAEPGEGFINKKAVKALGGKPAIDKINKAMPRFQVGGMAGMKPGISRLANRVISQFGGAISSGYRPGDDGFHGQGLAMDWVGGDWAGAAKYMNRIGKSLLEGIYTGAHGGPQVSWDSGKQVSPSFWGSDWAPHSTHIHAAIAAGAKVAAMVKDIKRVLLKGDKGPLKDLGQAALDKTRKAANQFLSQKSMVGPERGVTKGLMGKGQIASVWRRANQGQGDANLMAAIALAESAGDPGAVGHDPGGTQGLGLWQITTGFNDDLIKRWGGRRGMFNALNNAQAAGDLLARQGLGAWVVYNSGAYRQHMQQGGMVPFVGSFDKGGTVAQTGLGMLHKGEEVLSMQAGGSVPMLGLRRLMDRLPHDIKRFVGALHEVSLNLSSQLSPGKRERLKHIEKIDPEDRTKKQQKELIRLRKLAETHAKLTKDERRDRIKLRQSAASYSGDLKKMKTAFGADNRLSESEKKRLKDFRAEHRANMEHLHDLNEQRRLHRREERRERRLEGRIERGQARIAGAKELAEQLKELRLDIKEHNSLYKSVRVNEKAALRVLSNLVGSQIGSQGHAKTRLASAGSVVRY